MPLCTIFSRFPRAVSADSFRRDVAPVKVLLSGVTSPTEIDGGYHSLPASVGQLLRTGGSVCVNACRAIDVIATTVLRRPETRCPSSPVVITRSRLAFNISRIIAIIIIAKSNASDLRKREREREYEYFVFALKTYICRVLIFLVSIALASHCHIVRSMIVLDQGDN